MPYKDSDVESDDGKGVEPAEQGSSLKGKVRGT